MVNEGGQHMDFPNYGACPSAFHLTTFYDRAQRFYRSHPSRLIIEDGRSFGCRFSLTRQLGLFEASYAAHPNPTWSQ